MKLLDLIIFIDISFIFYLFFNIYVHTRNISLFPSLFRPAVSNAQSLSDYLRNGEPVQRGNAPWKSGRPNRLFIGRLIGNDLWPMVSPCRSRINMARIIRYTSTPESINIQYDGGYQWIRDEEHLSGGINYKIGEQNLTKKLDVIEIWAPYRILNGTEHRLILELLEKKNSLVFSVPVDFPSLALADNYIAYLTNVALARHVVLREANSLGAAWTLLTTANHHITSESYQFISRAIEGAEKYNLKILLIPVFKLVNASRTDEIFSMNSIHDFASRVVRLPPHILISPSANMKPFVENFMVDGTQSMIKAIKQLITTSEVGCSFLFNQSSIGISDDKIKYAQHCGYLIELESFPLNREECFFDLEFPTEFTLATDSNIQYELAKTSAEVFLRFIELSLNIK